MASIGNGTTTITDLVVTGVRLQRVTSTVTHTIVGRSAPLAVLGATSARAGVIIFRVATLGTVEALVTLCQGKVCTLTAVEHPSISGMSFVVQDWASSEIERGSDHWWWELQLGLAEV